MVELELYVDRIEGDEEKYAVIELPDLSNFTMKKKYLPEGITDGSLLKFTIEMKESK